MEITATMLDQFALAELSFLSGKKLSTRSTLNTITNTAQELGLNLYQVYSRGRTFLAKKETISAMLELKRNNLPADQIVIQAFNRLRVPYLEKKIMKS